MEPTDIAGLTRAIKQRARELGFDDCRIASVAQEADDGFDHWLAEGHHADMEWMARTREVRQHVALKVPGARSVIVLAKNYHQPALLPMPETGKIARYARRRDYHRSLFKPLKHLAAFIRGLAPGAACYASTDSGPVRERIWASRAGLGWIGRHGLVIHPKFGSWFHLATIITTLELDYDAPVPDRCGTCSACVEACPTGAIVADRVVDSRRCISFHTIENRGAIPPVVAEGLHGWVFGCDLCQEVCPWNRREQLETAEGDKKCRTFPLLDAEALLALSEEEFYRLYLGTPVMRAKYAGMRRNAALTRDAVRREIEDSGEDD